MTIEVSPVPLEGVLGLRELYRQEMNCQIIQDSLPGRGFSETFSSSGLMVASRATGSRDGR